jgi:hypothetical protein
MVTGAPAAPPMSSGRQHLGARIVSLATGIRTSL